MMKNDYEHNAAVADDTVISAQKQKKRTKKKEKRTKRRTSKTEKNSKNNNKKKKKTKIEGKKLRTSARRNYAAHINMYNMYTHLQTYVHMYMNKQKFLPTQTHKKTKRPQGGGFIETKNYVWYCCCCCSCYIFLYVFVFSKKNQTFTHIHIEFCGHFAPKE